MSNMFDGKRRRSGVAERQAQLVLQLAVARLASDERADPHVALGETAIEKGRDDERDLRRAGRHDLGDDPFDSGAINAIRTFQDTFNYVPADIVDIVYGYASDPGEIKGNQTLMQKAFQLVNMF